MYILQWESAWQVAFGSATLPALPDQNATYVGVFEQRAA